MGVEELWVINAKLSKPDISLKEISDLWFEAKNIISSASDFDDYDVKVSVDIFNEGIKKVNVFYSKWLDGKFQPTDKELDLFEKAFDEASWAFGFLSTNLPSVCSVENNEGWQKKIKENKKIVSEEKDKRKQLKSLESQVNSLSSQPSNNEAKIKDLQRKIDELRKSKPNGPISLKVPQQSTSKNDDNNNYLVGFGVCLVVLLVGYLVLSKKKKKNQ